MSRSRGENPNSSQKGTVRSDLESGSGSYGRLILASDFLADLESLGKSRPLEKGEMIPCSELTETEKS